MAKRTRDEYFALRQEFEPSIPAVIIVAESPPASGLYFYDPTGAATEPLFSALMKQLNVSVSTREAGLREFQKRGWVLVDATYEPVNTLTNAARDRVIGRDYQRLLRDLCELDGAKATPLILLKANVCRILEAKLVSEGFNVLNRGRPVYFPSSGKQGEFHRQFRGIVREFGIG